jgi:hypothetical protein
MSSILLDLPDEALATARRIAADNRLSIDQVFTKAIGWMAEADRLSADFDARAARGRHVDIDAILAKVPDVPPVPGDELPDGFTR